MHISALEEYGLRVALQLARAPSSVQLSAAKIAEQEDLSLQYVSKILYLFRKAGLVKAVRGIHGGFFLSEPAAQIRLKKVFDCLKSESDRAQDQQHFCHHFSGLKTSCTHIGSCGIRPVWSTLLLYFEDLLKTLTLADLLREEAQVHARVSSLAQEKANAVKAALLNVGRHPG